MNKSRLEVSLFSRHRPTKLSAAQVGEAAGTRFTREREVLIFVPASGDVALCSAGQCGCLPDSHKTVLPGAPVAVLEDGCTPPDKAEQDLKSLLASLGSPLV